jgi:hypothetical protein
MEKPRRKIRHRRIRKKQFLKMKKPEPVGKGRGRNQATSLHGG